MNFFASVGLVLAAVVAVGIAAPVNVLLGCHTDDLTAPTFTEIGVGKLIKENTTSVVDCSTTCLEDGYVYAAMSEGIHCFCSSDEVAVPALPAATGTCELLCGGEACGSELDTSYLSVYHTGGGSPNFTMTATTDGAVIDIGVVPLATGTTFLVNYDYGAPISYFNDTAAMMGVDGWLVPGTYEVTVIGQIEGTPFMSVQRENLTKTGVASSIDLLHCPIVWEPDELYYCNISVTPIDENTLYTVTFDDTNEVFNIQGLGADIYRLGNPPPRSITSEVSAPASLASVIRMVNHPIVIEAELLAIDLYGFYAGSFTVSVQRPTCASGIYCVHVRGCMEECPFDSLGNAHTCAAPQVFCPMRRTCSDAGGAATCMAPEAPPLSWDDVPGTNLAGAFAGEGYHRELLAAPVLLLPGDVIHVTGPVGRLPGEGMDGDEVDGVNTNFRHFIAAIVKENVPIQVSHICTTVDLDVNADAVGVGNPAVPLANHTSCERNITDVAMVVNQVETDAFDDTLNLEEPYYIRTVSTAIFTAIFSVAGPVTFTYTYFPSIGINHTFEERTDFPLTDVPYELEHEVIVPFDGVYTVTISAENQHNDIPGPITNEVIVMAQHMVVTTWSVVADSPLEAFKIPTEAAKFRFADSAVKNFPTNASATCDWGDGTVPEILPFVDPGNQQPILEHTYTKGGVYTMTANIFNKVSEYEVTCVVTIIEEIHDFVITNKYFPTLFATDSRPGFGRINNQYPMDKNLTFYPSMSQGTVNSYEVEFTNNNSHIFTFPVVDRFNPMENHFHYHFDMETFLNLTVFAVNIFERVPVDIFVEIVGQVRIAQIEDYSLITEKDEEKTFEISFESLGGGTCLVIDWGDTNPMVLFSFGEEITCMANFSHASYSSEPLLDIANNFTHIYKKDGVYNITAFAYNPVSVTSDVLMFLVTSIKCRPPIVEIFDGTLDYLAAVRVYRGEDNAFASVASINCEVTSKTKKRWQIYAIDSLWGYVIKPILTMEAVETWDMSEIIIPARYLSYGIYRLTYTLTMWDPEVLDPRWPFQKQVDMYIEIIKTPIVAVMFEGGVTRIIRGLIQEIPFEPGVYSIDPDFPDQKDFTITWRCRELGEAWPADDTTPLPIWTKGTAGTGCFGHGPGMLDYSDPVLTVLGSDFIAVDKIYEMEAIVTKDTRISKAMGQVQIVSYVPPIIRVSCMVEALCKPDGNGVYVNPSLKMAVVAECIDYCTEPFTNKWTASDELENPFPVDPAHFTVGDTGPEVALSTQFFDDHYDLKTIMVGVESTDPDGNIGGAIYFMKINQRPIDGFCRVTEPPTRLALVDTYHIECGEWGDPEGKGISYYGVFSVSADGVKTPLTDVRYSTAVPQITDLVLPPGVFDIIVHVTDKWDAFTVYTAKSDMEVLMPTQEQVEAADIMGRIEDLSGAGNTPLLTMVLAAQQAVTSQASWLSLAEEDIAGLTREELDARISYIADQNNAALDALMENTNYNTLGSISAAASTVAGILAAASANLEACKAIDIEARDKVADVSEDILNGLLDIDAPSPDLLIPLVNYMATIAGGMALGQSEAGTEETCKNAPPSDIRKADDLPFETRVTGIDMVIPEDPREILTCNVRDVTKERAQRLVPLIEKVLDQVTERILKRMLIGEEYSISTPNGMHLKLGIASELTKIDLGNSGGGFIFPSPFCPQPKCPAPTGYSSREWPFITHAYPPSAENLAPGTKVLDLLLYTRKVEPLVVEDLKKEIISLIPRTAGKMGNNTLPDFERVNATFESAKQFIPTIYTTFNVSKNGSSVNLEIIPERENSRLFVMISKPRLPTLRNHEYFSLVKDIPEKNGTHDWFFLPSDLNGTGRYFVGVGEFASDFNIKRMRDPVAYNVTGSVLTNVSTNYQLRIFTSGCYFFDKKKSKWDSNGLKVVYSDHKLTRCNTTHLTSFGSGMFVMPNTIDFNYVFANMGFNDNLTIYLTLIITLSIFVLLMIWARIGDKKDVQKLGAAPLPDNKVEDKYFYEMLVFTGNHTGAQTDSVVQFILSGDDDETDVRTLGDSKRRILRKASVDVFVLAVSRPLGSLQYLRIWHDNSGKGPNASWHLSYIVFRDVQTGDKYEFIANQWLAVEHDDGQIDRMLPVASTEQKTQFKHLFHTTKNKNLADGHLWFSVFLRPPRSRFTRCQRVASCFALLFLSMLVNAMWYDQVPEQPGMGGLNVGPFSLSPEQIGVGVMSNLIVFPPSFLIVFLFRKSRPRKLRKSRIEEAVARTKREKGVTDGSDENETHKKIIHKKEKNKKFTLPWWCKLIAWLLVIACIVVSCFFLLMYGIMFGNSKATKWVTSLIISFFSSVLFVQPLKIFLTAMLVSAILKSVDLDEDDSDEDEEDPNLEHDELWLHKGEKSEKTFKQRKIDSETLRQLREARQKEVEMWGIIKEIFFYSFFLWILLILSYGNRDPNAFFMMKSLRHEFLHEGALDGTDYTKVTNANKLWRYLFTGLMPDLRADFLYNGKPPYGLRGFFNDWCNRVMGYATIRQIRTEDYTCRVPDTMSKYTTGCSGFTSLLYEESNHYCTGWVLPDNDTKETPECKVPEFRYETASQLQSLPIWGNRDWYGGGGYVIHLKDGTQDILKNLRYLQENNWIDSRTRAVIIEFSSYNSQVNLFGLSLIMAEFTPGGGITPYFRFEGIRLLQHHDNFGFFIICCEIIFVMFVVYYTVREIKLAIKLRRHYFDSYWSYAEISIIIACFLAMVMYLMRYMATEAVLSTFSRTSGNGYVKLQYAASLDEAYGYLVGFIVFVGTIKFTKLLRFNKRIGILSATLHQCWDDLSGFLMAFFLCFCSFVLLFYLLLNMYLEGFYNFVTAIETCFSMMLGKFQFEEMKQASMMVPIMFFIFVLCNSWVLINLLLTLIIKSFQEVKRNIMKQPNEYEMVAFVWGRFKAFLGLGGITQNNAALTTTVKAKPDEDQNNKVNELPTKVDKFLEYLNSVYFSGSLDVNNRDALKSSFYRSQMARKASGIIEANNRKPNSGWNNSKNPDDDLGNSLYPGSGWNRNSGWRSSRNSGAGRNGNNADNWHGAIDDGRSGVLSNRGKGNQNKQDDGRRSDRGPTYDGPRICNKFQADLDDI